MSELLKQINSPDDVKSLSIEQLEQLAGEVRSFIIDTVSATGGHLASNLGIVEITLALHYVFDFKTDKLLWDVGHQCYAHKIITGRKDDFNKLRTAGGPSGFPNPDESEYDRFTVGHAGTALATSIGMALGHMQNADKAKIISVIGDASIVNGASFEALNNLGLVKRQLLVILNDNSMAIDSTEGAVAKYFSQLRLSQTYEDMVKTGKNILEHMSVFGKGVDVAIERLKKALRMVFPQSQLFESMNIPYYGPMNGHDLQALVRLFRAISHLDRPAVLHLFTQKGKGFAPAEKDRPKYHSTRPFSVNGDIVDPIPAAGKSYTSVFSDHIVELARQNDKIVAITSAMREGTGLHKFNEEFPERFYDIGIAESAAVDIAAGFARSGLKPVVCIYSTFLQRSFDQIFQEVSLQNLPVVFCIDRAGLVGADGPTHHGLMDIGFMRMLPNMVLVAPANAKELELALDFAVDCDGPVAIRYPKDIVPKNSDASGCNELFETGKSVTVKSGSSSKVAIVNYGCLLSEVLMAADKLKNDGIDADVINARFAAPIDDNIIELVADGKSVFTVEDHFIDCGFGSAVLEAVSKAGLDGARLKIIGVERGLIRHDTRTSQLLAAGINADGIVKTVKEFIARQGN